MTSVRYRVTISKCLGATTAAACCLGCLQQVYYLNSPMAEWINPGTRATMQVCCVWLAVPTLFAAIGTPKWGWLGFYLGWIFGFVLVPVTALLVVSLVR